DHGSEDRAAPRPAGSLAGRGLGGSPGHLRLERWPPRGLHGPRSLGVPLQRSRSPRRRPPARPGLLTTRGRSADRPDVHRMPGRPTSIIRTRQNSRQTIEAFFAAQSWITPTRSIPAPYVSVTVIADLKGAISESFIRRGLTTRTARRLSRKRTSSDARRDVAGRAAMTATAAAVTR